MIKRDNPIYPIVPSASHVGKEGYAVKLAGALVAIHDSATVAPFGVIVDGGLGQDSILPFNAGGPPIEVKLDAAPGTVVRGTLLQVTATGTFIEDAGTGARVLCAVAMETGVANELVEAILIRPRVVGNAVTLGNTNGEISALTFSATVTQAEGQALRDKCEEVADDVRAIYLALQTAGLLA